MSKEIIINHLEQEIRVAILENNMLSEVFYERVKDKSVVGNIYKGKILKVLPGMEAAFVDVGLSKAAFLYIDDIRINDEDIVDSDHKSYLEKQKKNITSLIKEGEDIIVQVIKGPIGTKGVRITCNISLAGRSLVFMPYGNNVGVSRQINDEKERQRLKQIVTKLKPKNTSLIVRTLGTDRSEEEFKYDIQYLTNTFKNIQQGFEENSSPALLYEDLNLTFQAMRDMLSDDVKSIIIDDETEYQYLKKYLKKYLPKFSKCLKLFSKQYNIFDYYDINKEIDRALHRKVWLKSGGYLIIDQAEALTAVDVNTGKFTGSDSHEQTIFQTNIEAAVELVYQLKLRDIGGIIIIDFIDMEDLENRNRVYQTLKEELKRDKTRSKILNISEIGLIEMTRKRSRENLDRYLCMPCPYCDGRGRVKSIITTVYDIYRDINRLVQQKQAPKNLLLGIHPDVAEYLEEEEITTFNSMQNLLQGEIKIRTSEKFHSEQYELYELD